VEREVLEVRVCVVVAMCCSVLVVAVCCSEQTILLRMGQRRCVFVVFLQCVAVCCSVLQCGAVCSSEMSGRSCREWCVGGVLQCI